MKNVKLLEPFELHKLGITVIKPSASFASKLSRFESKNEIKYMSQEHVYPADDRNPDN